MEPRATTLLLGLLAGFAAGCEHAGPVAREPGPVTVAQGQAPDAHVSSLAAAAAARATAAGAVAGDDADEQRRRVLAALVSAVQAIEHRSGVTPAGPGQASLDTSAVQRAAGALPLSAEERALVRRLSAALERSPGSNPP